MATAIALFTRDLRRRDNPMLAAAARADAVVPLFVVDPSMERGWHGAPNRRAFLHDALVDLDAQLRDRDGSLVVRTGAYVRTVVASASEAGATEVHIARDASAYAQRRATALRDALGRHDVVLVEHPGVTVVEPGAIRPAGGGPFKVFTPYYRRWLATPWRAPVRMPARLAVPPTVAGDAFARAVGRRGPTAPHLPPGGESAGLALLQRWAASALARYAQGHDDLPGDATSRISPYLHFGCVSPLEVATRLRDRPGGDAFVRQLCWRDFYTQLLAAQPDLAHDDLRARVQWVDDDEGFAAWTEGRTGFPLVDAGMRQLLAEGWMHNRARMVTASFLTKDLGVDWRRGADWFMAHLVDGDVANNQLNWQWVAGTGTDTNPHRVYNPTRQSERFDPDGAYIRRYVGELAGVPAPEIHDPALPTRERVGYPPPWLDHRAAIEASRARRV